MQRPAPNDQTKANQRTGATLSQAERASSGTCARASRPRRSFAIEPDSLVQWLRRSRELADGLKHDLNRVSYLRSNSSRRRASSACVKANSRSCTKARTTWMLVWTAVPLRSTFANITAPCSVKTLGSFRRPPRPAFDVANCDFKVEASPAVSRNMKSVGNLSWLRFTCSFKRLVDTPYSAAKSQSSMTRCPRIS